jgi:predicted DNA-binding transcriptional regulator AlpA
VGLAGSIGIFLKGEVRIDPANPIFYWSRTMPKYDLRKTKSLPHDFHPDTMLRVADFCSTSHTAGILPISPSAFYRRVDSGEYPRGIPIGTRVRVWPAREIYKIRDAMLAKFEGPMPKAEWRANK